MPLSCATPAATKAGRVAAAARRSPTAGRWGIGSAVRSCACGWGSRRSSMWASSRAGGQLGFHLRQLPAFEGGGRRPRVLNLFAYTGGATLAARAAGAGPRMSIRCGRSSRGRARTWRPAGWTACGGLSKMRSGSCSARSGAATATTASSRPSGIRARCQRRKWILEDNICEMLECCAQLLEPAGAFLVLNLYSMGLSSTLAARPCGRLSVLRATSSGAALFLRTCRKQLPLGFSIGFTR